MLIRCEALADIPEIERLTYAAFLNHPQHKPGSLPTEHKIVQSLRDAGALKLSLVAKDNGSIVGHAAFSPILIDGSDCKWVGLGPVSVITNRQRSGIGSALIKRGIELLKAEGICGCALVGDPAYYERFGFRANKGVTLDGVPAQYFLSMPFNDTIPNGVVTFHPAFSVI